MPDSDVKRYLVFVETQGFDDVREVVAHELIFNKVTGVSSKIGLAGRDKVVGVFEL